MTEDAIWVFGYGSLMWNPGFPYGERLPARVFGVHRQLCVRSTLYRGTPDRPGLVMGLDRGGSCTGSAYRVGGADAAATLAYLDDREMVYSIYRRVRVTVRPIAGGDPVAAWTYVVARGDPLYAGHLDAAERAAIVATAAGRSGSNRAYLENAVAEIRTLGIRDRRLEDLLDRQSRS